ncbi:HipA domain-containing protein [Helicobacter suis]|uniref:HipA domain-containing protein n=1 Tax=Helicobacter suis TaxID=104628 RepID=UPI0013D829C0|nr:HipA domain-containing protein [Helicobacter suis]
MDKDEGIDFTTCLVDHTKLYDGSNGSKVSILWKDEHYMLKFPPKPKPSKKLDMSYINSCFSEYIACHIIDSLGMSVQETLLGTYKDKVVVACKDFTGNVYQFVDFTSVKNSIVSIENGGWDTTLTDVLFAIDQQKNVDSLELKRHFWDMFIADALLANFDRHNGNWGLLKNFATQKYSIAPIFDCGSCLLSQIDEATMFRTLNNKQDLNNLTFLPYSALKDDRDSALKDDRDKKITYFNFLTTTENKDCLNALVKLHGKIDMAKIYAIIDNTPYASTLHKDFLKVILEKRKEKIIDVAYTRALDFVCKYREDIKLPQTPQHKELPTPSKGRK